MSVYCIPVSDEHSDMLRQAFVENYDTFIFMYQSKLPLAVCLHCSSCEKKRCLEIYVLMSPSGFISTLRLGHKKFFLPL
jgi:hypothetical protein